MKKVFALGVSGLLMLGAASQAAASFEAGNYTMSVYDMTNNQQMVVDLGAITDLTAENVVVASGFDLTGWDLASGGVGINADMSTPTAWYHEGVFATNNDTGTTVLPTFTNGQAFSTGVKGILNSANTLDTDADGIVTYAADFAGGYNSYMNVTHPGGYAGVQGAVGVEGVLSMDEAVELYLYQFTTDAGYALVSDQEIKATFTIDAAAGTVVMNAPTSEVPIPGAVFLLGSGLAGLVGIRRRK